MGVGIYPDPSKIGTLVTSVAGRSGVVTLTAADIGAGTFPAGTYGFGQAGGLADLLQLTDYVGSLSRFTARGSLAVTGGIQASGATTQQGNLLTANQSSIETDTSGWSAYSNCSITRSTAQSLDGTASLALTSTAAGDMWAGPPGSSVGFGAPAVTAGKVYTAVASFRAAVSPRPVFVQIDWYASGSYVSSTVGGTSADNTAGWNQATVTGQAPATATNAEVLVRVVATGAAAEVHYVDRIGLFPDPFGNLVDTPDFESGLGARWVATTNCTITQSVAQAYTGRASMAMTITAGGAAALARTGNGAGAIPLLPNTTYIAVHQSRASVNGRLMRLRANLFKSDGTNAAVSLVDSADIALSSTGWTQQTLTFTTGADVAFGAVGPRTNTDAATNDVYYLDAVQLVVGSTATTYVPPSVSNLVTNPSFEVDVSGWSVGTRIVLTRDTTRAYIGTASGKLTLTAGAAEAIVMPIPVQAGVPLTIQYRAYVPSATTAGTGGVYMDITGPDAFDGPNVGADMSIRDQWQLVTGTMTPTTSGVANLRMVTTGSAVGVMWVDAIQVEFGSVANPYVDGNQGPGYSWDASNNLLSAAAASFEDGTVGGWGAIGATLSNSTLHPQDGTKSLQLVVTAAFQGAFHTFAAASGTTITCSAYFYGPADTYYLGVADGVDGNGAEINIALPANTLTRVVFTTTITAAQLGSGGPIVYAKKATAGTFFIDAVQVEQRSYATPYAQAGTANAATSTYQQPWYVGTAGVGARVEVGRSDGVASVPRLDFHSSGLSEYDVRLMAAGGATAAGQGGLTLFAHDVVVDWHALGNSRHRITSDGATEYYQTDHALMFSALFSGTPRVVINPLNTVSTMVLYGDSSLSRGGELALADTKAGQATPNKYLRSNSGQLQIANSAYTAVIVTVDDSGNLGVTGTIADSSGRVYSPGNPPPGGASANDQALAVMGVL